MYLHSEKFAARLSSSRIKKNSIRKGSGNIAEFAAALFAFFFFGVYPLCNLLFVACDAATIAMITSEAASAAGAQVAHQEALDAMQSKVTALCTTGFGKFARLSQSGGYQNCGANLYIVETNTFTKAVAYYGPNTPYALPVDSANFIYEYRVVSNFTVAPFINLSSIPFIGQVPLVGQSTKISWAAERLVEIVAGGNGTAVSGLGSTPGSSGSTPGSSGSTPGSSGSTPGSSGSTPGSSGSTPGSSGTAGAQPSGCII